MINHNILHLIIRKYMDLHPHPLAQMMKALLYSTFTVNPIFNGPYANLYLTIHLERFIDSRLYSSNDIQYI